MPGADPFADVADAIRFCERDDFVDRGMGSPEFSEFGSGEKRDVSAWLGVAQAQQRGSRHDGVAEPIDAANENTF